MTNEQTEYVNIMFRTPRVLRDWLNRRAKIEMTNASTIVRRLVRNYVSQVDAVAFREMESVLLDEADGKENADGERQQSNPDR